MYLRSSQILSPAPRLRHWPHHRRLDDWDWHVGARHRLRIHNRHLRLRVRNRHRHPALVGPGFERRGLVGSVVVRDAHEGFRADAVQPEDGNVSKVADE